MWHVWGRGEMHTGIWRENLRERSNLKTYAYMLVYNIKMDLQEMTRAWTGLIWLRTGKSGKLLQKWL